MHVMVFVYIGQTQFVPRGSVLISRLPRSKSVTLYNMVKLCLLFSPIGAAAAGAAAGAAAAQRASGISWQTPPPARQHQEEEEVEEEELSN
jgi:hypothetical protein